MEWLWVFGKRSDQDELNRRWKDGGVTPGILVEALGPYGYEPPIEQQQDVATLGQAIFSDEYFGTGFPNLWQLRQLCQTPLQSQKCIALADTARDSLLKEPTLDPLIRASFGENAFQAFYDKGKERDMLALWATSPVPDSAPILAFLKSRADSAPKNSWHPENYTGVEVTATYILEAWRALETESMARKLGLWDVLFRVQSSYSEKKPVSMGGTKPGFH